MKIINKKTPGKISKDKALRGFMVFSCLSHYTLVLGEEQKQTRFDLLFKVLFQRLVLLQIVELPSANLKCRLECNS